MERLFRLIKNRYFLSGLIFIVWMSFFDRYDLGTQYAYQQEKNKLEEQKAFYEEEILTIEKAVKDVQYNPNEIQRIARERYKMKKDNEDIFVIEEVEPTKK
ncbi:septum formation initiator family protein [Sphingobacterium sp. UT-1RO-CII-1]|uniref:FtsB family cell division protein n=1 Tax=Sphingobacterium sp. UT-1RO-CII-1 TaxID=2995225 RepID=UPI002279FF97|nr:septum formation initiator family protein [Sphingobacterium sp. UT-1RO-CII-1]MCY4780210.1 septum formation initiator family protein [Sphingobacterium sp. UT-1RO-CII-1]